MSTGAGVYELCPIYNVHVNWNDVFVILSITWKRRYLREMNDSECLFYFKNNPIIFAQTGSDTMPVRMRLDYDRTITLDFRTIMRGRDGFCQAFRIFL